MSELGLLFLSSSMNAASAELQANPEQQPPQKAADWGGQSVTASRRKQQLGKIRKEGRKAEGITCLA